MSNINEITAIILAGGLGTRLRSVVSDKPKVMAEVLNRPFLEYLLDQLICAGFGRVILCTGHMAEQIEGYFGSSYKGINLVFSKETQPLGTAGAVRLALERIKTDYILVMNGDSYVDVNVAQYVDWFFKKGCAVSLVLTEIEETYRYGRVLVDKEQRILSFEEKSTAAGSGLINAGIYAMKKSIIAELDVNKFCSIEKDLFPNLVENKKLLGFTANGDFIDIGVPESYAKAENFFTRNLTNKTI